MNGNHSFVISILVLRVSVSASFVEYGVGEVGGQVIMLFINFLLNTFQEYTLIEYNDPFKLQLVQVDSNGSISTFDLPACGQLNATIHDDRVKVLENVLYMHIKNPYSNLELLVSVDLEFISKDKLRETCMEVADTYFGEHKIYVYTVTKKRILKRLLIARNGEETNFELITKTRNVFFSLSTIILLIFSQS